MNAITLQHNLTALAEAFLDNAQGELIASAAAGEDQVTAAIEQCLAYHRGAPCQADPHECLDVRFALVAADAAAEMVAAWLIATGAHTTEDDAALDAAGHLIAEALAAAETARLNPLELT
jgi:hypothetical protein